MAPRYRQIPTKTPDSFDFNDIPTDFGRMFWLMLPIALDREGRGIDTVQWLRSKLFPIREDDVTEQISAIMDWLTTRGMIIRYQVDGRKYFYSVNFKTYQSGTEKEAMSFLPPPPSLDNPTPDLLQTNSRLTPEQVRVNTMQCNNNNNNNASKPPADDYIPDTPYKHLEAAYVNATKSTIPTGGGLPTRKWIDSFKKLGSISGATPDDITAALGILADGNYPLNGPQSIINTVQGIVNARNVKSNSKPKTIIKFDPSGNPQEFPA